MICSAVNRSPTWEAPTRPQALFSILLAFSEENVVQGQSAGARRHQQQKDEAEEGRPLTSVEDGPESPGEVGKEVGKGHLSAEEEGDGTGEQASGDKEGAEKLQDSGKPSQLQEARGVPLQNPEEFL